MMSRHRIGAVAAALALGIIATSAQAAPIARSGIDLRADARESVIVDKAASRRCWRHNGKRHCARRAEPRVYGYRNQGSDYTERLPEKLPYGSQAWWNQMQQDNRAGNPGGGGRN